MTGINVFLKQFIANKGFPFQVLVPKTTERRRSVINVETLDMAVKRAVSDETINGTVNKFTYLDPQTKKLVTVIKDETEEQ